MAEDRLVLEGEVTWSEGDATHYGGLEIRIGEDEWAEVGQLIAERFAISEGDRRWLDWFAAESLGELRITVERIESSSSAEDDGGPA